MSKHFRKNGKMSLYGCNFGSKYKYIIIFMLVFVK